MPTKIHKLHPENAINNREQNEEIAGAELNSTSGTVSPPLIKTIEITLNNPQNQRCLS
jgi:hypothetical protein